MDKENKEVKSKNENFFFGIKKNIFFLDLISFLTDDGYRISNKKLKMSHKVELVFTRFFLTKRLINQDIDPEGP